jgi:hypothetical protein
VIKEEAKDKWWDALGLASCSGKMLASTQLAACGPTTSSELAPSLIVLYDGRPTRYAHVTMN